MNAIERRNTVLSVIGESLWGLQSNMIASATVLTVLLTTYGAGNRLIGAIGAIETGAILLPQLLSAYIFTSRRHLKRDLILWHLVMMIPFLGLMGVLTFLAPRLSPGVYRMAMLGSHGLFVGMMGMILPAWLDWQARVFSTRIRGTVFGLSFTGAFLAGTVGALLAGQIVKHLALPGSYALLYAMAFVLATMSILTFGLLADASAEESAERVRPDTARYLAQLAESLRDPNYRAFLVGRVLAGAGFAILPFIAVHFASPPGGALTASLIVSCGAAMTVGGALGNLVLGRLGDHHGHRYGVIVGVVMQLVSLGVLLVVPGMVGGVAAYFAAGLSTQGMWSSHSNIMIETCPHDSRMVHISAGNLVLGGATALMPLIAGELAERFGLRVLFAVSLGFSLLALLWFLFRVKEPRDLSDP